MAGVRAPWRAECAVLARMIDNETEEKRSGIIKLDDVTAAGLLAFVEFLYLGTMSASIACAFLICDSR
jgi:hypothetical protein